MLFCCLHVHLSIGSSYLKQNVLSGKFRLQLLQMLPSSLGLIRQCLLQAIDSVHQWLCLLQVREGSCNSFRGKIEAKWISGTQPGASAMSTITWTESSTNDLTGACIISTLHCREGFEWFPIRVFELVQGVIRENNWEQWNGHDDAASK